MSEEPKTPMLDVLVEGPWPSFVRDLKDLARTKPQIEQLLGQMERSYEDRINYWTGTVLNLSGYGGGIIARYSDLKEEFPDVAQFHTIRVIPPPAFVYSTDSLRELCDISEEFSSGIMQLHGMTGDLLMVGSSNEKTHAAGEVLMERGWDIGGSGGALRTLACCIGQARCEMACFDTMGLTKHLTDTFISELHRPEFPYKFKFKLSGCANDCANSMQRSDMPVIGTWRDEIQVNQEEVGKFVDEYGEQYVIDNVITRCPTHCIGLSEGRIDVDDRNCVKCMHCINVMHKALAPGKDRGATILIGGKRTLKIGDMMSSMLIPFIKLETEEDWKSFTDTVRNIWEYWSEGALDHERIGEFIDRVGLGVFLDNVGIEPSPQMVKHPRTNSYIKFEEYAVPRAEGEPVKAPNIIDKDEQAESV